jgi:hypothetical protein
VSAGLRAGSVEKAADRTAIEADMMMFGHPVRLC